jgi:hypothetical protein
VVEERIVDSLWPASEGGPSSEWIPESGRACPGVLAGRKVELTKALLCHMAYMQGVVLPPLELMELPVQSRQLWEITDDFLVDSILAEEVAAVLQSEFVR